MKATTDIKNCFECPYNRKVSEHGAILYTCEHPKLEITWSFEMIIDQVDLDSFPKKCPLNKETQVTEDFLKGLAYAAKLTKKIRDRRTDNDPAITHGMSIIIDELDNVYERKKKELE